MEKKEYGLSAYLNLNRSCNMRCSYCYLKDHYTDNGLSKESLDLIYSFVEKTPVSNYTILGGEAFLEKEALFKILDIITEKNRKNLYGKKTLVGFITNGTIYLEDLKKYKDIITSLQITHDGPTHDTNRKFVNGKSSSEIIIQNVGKYLNDGFNVHMHSVLSKTNYKIFLAGAESFFTSWPYKDIPWNIAPETMLSHPEDQWTLIEYYKLFHQVFQLSKRFTFLDFFSFGGSICTGGSQMMIVDGETGDLYGCENMIGTDTEYIGKIGSLKASPVITEETVAKHLTLVHNVQHYKKIRIKYLPRIFTKKIILNIPICWAENLCYTKDIYSIPLFKIVHYFLGKQKRKWRKKHGQVSR